jgi:hypothetical protein
VAEEDNPHRRQLLDLDGREVAVIGRMIPGNVVQVSAASGVRRRLVRGAELGRRHIEHLSKGAGERLVGFEAGFEGNLNHRLLLAFQPAGGAFEAQPAHVLGDVLFVYAVAPHHPLAKVKTPITDDMLQKHRAVAVADTVQSGSAATFGLLAGQDVLTVPSMRAKLDAQLRGLGGGFVPEPMAHPYIEQGTLVVKEVARKTRSVRLSYAWRASATAGRAVQWWLAQLERPATRRALLYRHYSPEP